MNRIFELIKNTFLNEFQSAMSGERIASALLVSFFVSIFIVIIYKLTFSGAAFNKSYAFTLILASMVTSVIIMTVTTNLALSLGMVGALSIVRFRTAVKEPNDTVFMFWAICVGIMAGAGLIFASFIVNVSVGILYLAVVFIAKKFKSKPYLLVIKYDSEKEETVNSALAVLKNTKVRSRIVSGKTVEITLSLALTPKTIHVVDSISEIEGVVSCAAVSYNGDTTL